MKFINRHATPRGSRKLATALVLSLGLALAWPDVKGISLKGAIDIGSDAVKTVTLSDSDVKQMASQFANHSDSTNKVEPSNSKHTERLLRLTKKHVSEDGLKLNFKVYNNPQVNAFSLADGTIRFYSGLLDLMTDDEVLFVLGHEIGHVKEGHSKAKMRMAFAASAARKSVAYQKNNAGVIASGQLGALGEELLNKQFSQSEERAADDYSLKFIKKHGYSTSAAASALRKFSKLGGKHGALSTHPDPEDRAKRIEKQIK